MQESKPYEFAYHNRLVRLCSEKERADFLKDPAKYWALLDQAAIKGQGPDYPLAACVVSNEKLGSMGEALNVVFAGRLLRLCCKGCVEEVEKKPAEYIAKVDAARGKAGKVGEQKEKKHGG